MLTWRVTEPPGPEQASTNVLVADKAPVDREPDVARLPAQSPLALQELAPVVLHVSVAD
jgi:hypothetical protein